MPFATTVSGPELRRFVARRNGISLGRLPVVKNERNDRWPVAANALVVLSGLLVAGLAFELPKAPPHRPSVKILAALQYPRNNAELTEPASEILRKPADRRLIFPATAPGQDLSTKKDSLLPSLTDERTRPGLATSFPGARALYDPYDPLGVMDKFRSQQGTGSDSGLSLSRPTDPIKKTLVMARGETFIEKIKQLGVASQVAHTLAASLEPVYRGKLWRQGQKLTVTLGHRNGDSRYPLRVAFSPGAGERIIVEASAGVGFDIRIEDMAGELRNTSLYGTPKPYRRAQGRIASSLYEAATDRGVPGSIIDNMVNIFSHEIDFQRQIRSGDQFEVFYGQPIAKNAKAGPVLHYAALTLSGQRKGYYRFVDPDDGSVAYYDQDGKSINRSIMRTPVPGARISSGFGMRRHPVLGFNRMHKGLDFAAPTGTPVHAAGAGTVVAAGWRRGFGHTVILRHDKRHKTLYAHMHRIAKGLKEGHRVAQGQLIGYVGSTGQSTGPHLHYEVHVNGRAVDPKRVVLAATGTRLAGNALKRFHDHKAHIEALMAGRPASTQIADISK